jgi:hypothetical protein
MWKADYDRHNDSIGELAGALLEDPNINVNALEGYTTTAKAASLIRKLRGERNKQGGTL